MREIFVKFVGDKTLVVMNIIEKRDYIHNHLHQIDDKIVNELFDRVRSYMDKENEELSEELKAALNEGIASLEQGRSSSHEQVMSRMKKRYPNLIK
ncbi:MAG: hypothetical protein MI922_20610 [Bacteroidales bacterium]|nr:hypothetical protein [Bacteroidales bacterium]